jgi:aminoglycoside phosphotransferase (APT) family kinase protein
MDLPASITDWLGGLGKVTRMERAVARREAWLADVTQPDGTVLEGFFRLEREPVENNPWSLAKETGIVRALAGSPVPVPRVLAENPALHCTLFERVRGRADLNTMPAAQQKAVMEHFIDILADWHRLDPASLELPKFAQYPKTSRDCALGEVELIVAKNADFMAKHRDPLITYGLDWLDRNVPKTLSRVSLVQGDTGPVNFMFDGDRVSAIIDWEWGHLGDPMEDLGNVCVRNFWNPSGPLIDLFRRYEKRSGIPVDWSAVRYYRVQQNMRGMVPIVASCVAASPREPVAWSLAYRYTGDRSTVEAIADAEGVALLQPELPDEQEDDILAQAASWMLDNDIAPAIGNAFAKSRTRDVDILVRCLDRLRRHEKWIDNAELEDMGVLLGRKPASLQEGTLAMEAAIRERRFSDAQLLPYLGRRTYRLEWLYKPVTSLYPQRDWTPLA